MSLFGDKKVSELPRVTSPAQTDIMYIVASGEPRAVSRADLLQVIDSLASTSTSNPLSANQGRIIAALIAIANIRIGTWAEIQAVATATPAQPFVAVVTMPDSSVHGMMYLGTGDIVKGFIELGGGVPYGDAPMPPEVG